MNVLVACEESQRVCIAFRERGHNAFSCDLLPGSSGGEEMKPETRCRHFGKAEGLCSRCQIEKHCIEYRGDCTNCPGCWYNKKVNVCVCTFFPHPYEIKIGKCKYFIELKEVKK